MREAPMRLLEPLPEERSGLSRRRFLQGLGVIAGAGALGPLIARGRAEAVSHVEVTRPLLGTWIRVVARDADAARASRAIEDAFAAIREVDAQMSVHRADSQLSRVNRAAGVAEVEVDGAVIEVVARAREAAARTGGVYDPTVLPLMKLYGFYREGETPWPTERALARTMERVGHRQIAIDRTRRTLGLAHAGAGLDLGSIGKGWAVDRAVDVLRARGIRSGLVDAGGKVYGIGTPDPGSPGWSIGLFHPITKRLERTFVLKNTAVGTSGNSERFRVLNGVRVGHLFDARRGRPSNGHLAASVQAPTCLEADLECTVAFLLGPSAFTGGPGVQAVHFIG
jgi:thiamine biosynthesis lipoprotein